MPKQIAQKPMTMKVRDQEPTSDRVVWHMTRSEMFPFVNNPLVATLFKVAGPILFKGGDIPITTISNFETCVSDHLRTAKNSVVLDFGNDKFLTFTSIDGSNMDCRRTHASVLMRSPGA